MKAEAPLSPRFSPRLAKGVVLAALALGLSSGLGGCASSHIGDLPLVGLPASTPSRPEVQPTYLPVDDTSAPRSQPALTPAEQDKAAAELIAARDRQAKITGKQPAPPAPQ